MGQLEQFKANTSNLKAELYEANKKVFAVIKAIGAEILTLPDNPKATRISNNIVIINSRDLSADNWTAEYYNFKWQYYAVAAYIVDEKCGADQLLARIEKVLKEGKVPYPFHSAYVDFPPKLIVFDAVKFSNDYKQVLHPDVINNIKTILETA